MNVSRRNFLSNCALSSLAFTLGGKNSHAEGRPNVVLIVADDLGYGDLGCYGSQNIQTPNIDAIARQGVRFTNFYANAPECTPTRAALLTGRYQHRIGGLECAIGVGNVGRYDDALELSKEHNLGLPSHYTTISKLLHQIGYATAVCGKWHLGYDEKFAPKHHGFEYFFGPLGGNSDYFFHAEASGLHTLYQNDRAIRKDGYLTDLITDEATAFIQNNYHHPFFLYVPYTAPHSPYQAPGDKRNPLTLLSEKEWNVSDDKTYKQMIERMDEGIGRILRTLTDYQISENTMVIFMSDNGANKTGSNQPFRGYKGGLFEGGIHVPCIARFPNCLPQDVVSDRVCITMDFTAAIARFTNVQPPKNHAFDGIDVLHDIIENRAEEERTLFWRARRGDQTRWAVRDGDWKYIRNLAGNDVEEFLFDLHRDPQEQENRLYQLPAKVEVLKSKIKDWESEVRHPQRF